MAIEVYKEPLYRRYYVSSPCSQACIYMFVISFLMIFLPLFLGYNSTAFWLKDSTVYEQPKVQYTYQAIFQFYGQSGGEDLKLYFSTETLLNDVHNHLLRPGLISSSEVDDDLNGLTDRLDLSIKLPLSSDDSITGLDMLVFYEVTLQDRARYVIDAVTHFGYRNGGDAMGSLTVDSNIEFKQREKLLVKGGFQAPYQDDPLLPVMYEDTSLGDVQLTTILAKSAARNLTLGLNHNYVYAAPPSGAGDAFEAVFQLRVPQQYITYSPGVSEVLKNAWIQFAAIFIVIFFLLDRMNSFVFTHRLVYANQMPDMVVKKMD